MTGFLGPNGAGKSTTMRMMVGLDRPTSGSVLVNGKPYAEHAAPLNEVGALLEARASHPGRSARNHLRALALTSRDQSFPSRPGPDDGGSHRGRATSASAAFSLGMGQRLGVAAALLGDPHTLILDEPVNGLDLDGIRWIRALLTRLADEGRTVFLSSHLMSEMAVTADHVIVIGKGRLLRDQPMADFIREASVESVRVLSPEGERLAEHLRDAASRARTAEQDRVVPRGRGRDADRGGGHQPRGREPAGRAGITLWELAPQAGSLEDAYLALTRDSLDYQDTDGPPPPGRLAAGASRRGARLTTITADARASRRPRARRGGGRGRPGRRAGDPAGRDRLGVAEVPEPALHPARPRRGGRSAMVAFGAIIAYNTRNPAGLDPEDVVASGPLQGYYLGQLLMAALGVLVVSGEYSSGMIRATLAAVPTAPAGPDRQDRRLHGGGRGLDGRWRRSSDSSSPKPSCPATARRTQLADGDTLRVVVGTGVYLTLVGLIGSAFGWIVRSTPGALVATLARDPRPAAAALLVFPSWGSYLAAYLPTGAGQSFSTSLAQPHALSPWTGLAVMVAWVVVGLVAAAVVLERKDA